jgi:hypothetical protein
MLAADRFAHIEAMYTDLVQKIGLLEIDSETLKLILYLKDGSNLRVTEQWEGEILKRYSYYWLTEQNDLKIGWDNAPHHKKFNTFPHHKHVDQQKNIQFFKETTLEEVINIIFKKNN